MAGSTAAGGDDGECVGGVFDGAKDGSFEGSEHRLVVACKAVGHREAVTLLEECVGIDGLGFEVHAPESTCKGPCDRGLAAVHIAYEVEDHGRTSADDGERRFVGVSSGIGEAEDDRVGAWLEDAAHGNHKRGRLGVVFGEVPGVVDEAGIGGDPREVVGDLNEELVAGEAAVVGEVGGFERRRDSVEGDGVGAERLDVGYEAVALEPGGLSRESTSVNRDDDEVRGERRVALGDRERESHGEMRRNVVDEWDEVVDRGEERARGLETVVDDGVVVVERVGRNEERDV